MPVCPPGQAGVALDLPAALLELTDAHKDAFENIERLEAGDDDRDAVVCGDRLVFLLAHDRLAHDRADMAGSKKALHSVCRRTEQRAHCRRTSTCGQPPLGAAP